MILLYGEVGESVHLFLPPPPLAGTAEAENGVDPGKFGLRYEGGFRNPLIEQVARAIRAELIDPTPAGRMLAETLAVARRAHPQASFEPESRLVPAAGGARCSRPAATAADPLRVGEPARRSPAARARKPPPLLSSRTSPRSLSCRGAKSTNTHGSLRSSSTGWPVSNAGALTISPSNRPFGGAESGGRLGGMIASPAIGRHPA